MNYCEKCGNELMDNEIVCPSCGHVAENNDEFQNVESQQTKKNGKRKSILITIICIVVARLIGGFVGEFTTKKIAEGSQIKDVEEFIERIEKYTPGHFDSNEYVSEKFGIRFTIDDNWEFCSTEDLKVASKESKANATASALAALEKEDMPQALKEKFLESIYSETEMCALYIADNMYVGDVSVGVMGVYGIKNTTVGAYAEEIKKRLNTTEPVTDEYIADSTYKAISAKITDVNGINTTVKMYIKIKDDMVCMITCRAVVGYEDQLFKAFEKNISAYN